MALAGGLRVTALGVAIGVAAAAGLIWSLGSLLFGVKPVHLGRSPAFRAVEERRVNRPLSCHYSSHRQLADIGH